MKLQEKTKNVEKNLNKLFNKCWEDESFKQKLIANPTETMEAFYGRTLDTKGKKIVVNDQDDSSKIYINIPAKPNFEDLELTDNELEAVAGGWYVELLWSGVCFGDGDNSDKSYGVEV